MFEITDRPIAVDEVIKAVEHEGNGAVVTFLGVVRAHSKGKAVRYLEYEAYAEMAVPKLAEIAQEIHARWGLERVSIVHRVGHLEIGDTAVAIAVGSPHRGEGFEACRYAIDRIKSFVPVWKKEVWEDGEVWVGREGG